MIDLRYNIKCDRCGEWLYDSWDDCTDFSCSIKREAEQQGWKEDDGEWLCADCLRKELEEAEEDSENGMTRRHKKFVFDNSKSLFD